MSDEGGEKLAMLVRNNSPWLQGDKIKITPHTTPLLPQGWRALQVSQSHCTRGRKDTLDTLVKRHQNVPNSVKSCQSHKQTEGPTSLPSSWEACLLGLSQGTTRGCCFSKLANPAVDHRMSHVA